MCRRNHLCGCALIAFGLGVLIGSFLESGFFCFVMAVVIMGLGCWCMGKK